MSHSSDDESSDSSDDFLVPADKINFNSTFFAEKTTKEEGNLKADQNTDDETSDEELDSTNDKSANEVFTQILKNLESSNPEQSSRDISNDQDNNESASEVQLERRESPKRGSLLSKEITELLLQGESTTYDNEEDEVDNDDNPEDAGPSDYTIPKEGIKITLPGQNLMMNRKKKGKTDLETLLKNRMNQRLRSSQILIHKVGLLGWLAHGFYLNKQINDSEVMSIALSLVSTNNYPKGRCDLVYLEKFTRWFRKMFTIKEDVKEESITTDLLICRLQGKYVLNYKELVLLFVATLRAIGLNSRIVISLNPPCLKVPQNQLFKTKAEIIKEKERQKEKEKDKESQKEKNKEKESVSSHQKKTSTNTKRIKKEEATVEKVVPKNSEAGRKNANLEARRKAAAILQAKTDNIQSKHSNKKAKLDEVKIKNENTSMQQDNKNTTDSGEIDTLAKRLRSAAMKKAAISSDHVSTNKQVAKAKKETHSKPSTSKPIKSESVDKLNEDYESDNDFVEKRPVKRKLKSPKIDSKPKDKAIESKPKTKGQKYRKVISSDEESEPDPEKNKNCENLWAEVYVESEESWICVSIMDEKIHCVAEVYKKAAKPVLYIVAWNSVGSIKDVTRRYCPQWLTDTRKKRVDEKWWLESLCPWKEWNTAISRAEDEMLLQKELEQPLPRTLTECKGHPLYVIARHLLKFEALYPPDVVPLGHLPNGEAIYSRHCLHVLRSRETWLKQARVVKPAQEAYKIVKSMPKYDKLSGMKIKDQPLELFGIWQTTEYVPPEAKDGKVPRNEYGNVDLFKQCMLPKGTVHINLPGLNRIARKLDIDCAPAVVGFNFGGMGAVPAIEGYVVCSEFEDTLREAWEAEQIEAARRAREKREQRIYGNWKKLIKGLIIRERLAAKYGFHAKDDEEEASTSGKRAKHKKTDAKKAKVS